MQGHAGRDPSATTQRATPELRHLSSHPQGPDREESLLGMAEPRPPPLSARPLFTRLRPRLLTLPKTGPTEVPKQGTGLPHRSGHCP
ncbi:hypothetical protein NDU88_005063 [Pleurodeles waltl]|uniref:Uncharacterized protein n=1 Tax=Pleurodeles waltl TaxID=8319 RepID=A0AAV7M8V2_PLEWA|nr:hypothetical protein NDU88_005063 [Pleurodeles waltl]